jgi:hypothetical protein
MRRLTMNLMARIGQDAEERRRPRPEVRRDRHALRPCLEGCEPRLLLSGLYGSFTGGEVVSGPDAR